MEKKVERKQSPVEVEVNPVSLAADKEKQSKPVAPEGGLRAWGSVLGGVFIAATTFGYSSSFGVFQDYYTRTHASSASNISWIGSTQLFLVLVMGLPAGKLLDSGYFRHTLFAGTVIYCLSLFMVSVADPTKYYQLFLAQGLGMGIGSGLMYVPALAVQAHHWHSRHGLIMGIVSIGVSIGAIGFPIMLNELFKRIGFQQGVRASGYLVLGLQVIANLIMSAKSPDAHDGDTEKKPKASPNIKAIVFDIPYLLVVVSFTFLYIGFFFPSFYLQLFAVVQGVDTNTAFYLLPIVNAAAIPGRVLPNMLGDRLGPINVIIPFCVIVTALVFSLMAIHTTAAIIAFAVLYGFVSGTVVSLIGPMLVVLSNNTSELGIRFGVAWFITAFGLLVGNPVAGVLLGPSFVWRNAIIWSGVPMIIGICMLPVGRYLLVKRKGTQFV